MCLNDVFFIIILVCPNGTEYRHCSWNLSCSDITGVRRCKEQSPCKSGCFCSDGTVLQDGVCTNTTSCTGISKINAECTTHYIFHARSVF